MDGSIKQPFKKGFGRVKKLFHFSSSDPQPPTPPTEPARLPTTPTTNPQPMLPSNHSSAPLATTSSGPGFQNLPAAPAGQSAKHEDWAELKEFAGVLGESAAMFGPLKQAVDGIMMCVEVFEGAAENREDYQRLRAELNALFHDLAGCFHSPTPPVMTPSTTSLTKGIERELGLIKTQQWSKTGRFTNATRDADEVLECYRRIQGLLKRLQLNLNLSVWEIVDEQITENRLRNMSNSLAAYHNSTRAIDLRRGGCTPNTRVQVLEDLYHWAHDDESQKIYWLNGMAGTGKTTIAYSLCEQLENDEKLAASFFCSRQLPECRDINRIIPTISYQLAGFSRPFRSAISRILENQPDLHHRSLPEQFVQLIATPLREVQSTLPTGPIIVIDALDECEDHEGIGRILGVILSHSRDLPVKFFITSRPDANVFDYMDSEEGARVAVELRLHELERSTVQEDIRTYLTASLGSRMSISPADLDILVERSGVLFVVAASTVRYIGADNFSRGARRLRAVLDGSSDNSKAMDHLYDSILVAAFDDPNLLDVERAELQMILYTVICSREPISVDAMAGLLGLDSRLSVLAALRPLRSVLMVSETTHIITTLHGSFSDYMLDANRSGRLYCDAGKHNEHLACLCLRHINAFSSPFNICNLESSYLFDKDVPGIESRIEQAISHALLYACNYWGAHLLLAVESAELADMLLEFLSTRLLLWMEVMNLKRRIYDGARTLYYVQAWAQHAPLMNADIKGLLRDGWRFIISFSSSPARLSTPHIYMSTLTFWPEDRAITKCYRKQRSHLITEASATTDVRRTASLATVNTTRVISSLAYSPDGAYIISSSSDKTIRIWDIHSGEMTGKPLESHAGSANVVAYSPDGAYIVSGGNDNTIHTWDVRAGQTVEPPLEGHAGAVTSIAYSPDGAYLVSGSDDKTIRIWDMRTKQCMGQPPEGHTDGVTSVGYSRDGAYIASGSYDFTIRIWDTRTCQAVGRPLGGHTGTVSSVTYSPDGKHILSSSYDNTLRIWEASTGRIIGRPLQGATPVAYSPDGAYIVSGSHSHTMCIWDACTGQVIGQLLQGHTNAIASVVYSPDGAYIASSSYDATMRIWDVSTALTIGQSFQGHSSAVKSVAYSPDGAHIASSSCDGTTRIWDTSTGQAIGQPLHSHSNYITPVMYSPTGGYIVSGGEENTMCIWDVNTGQAMGQPLEGHTGAVTSVAYSPDGAYIVSGSDDKTIRLWDARTCQPISQLEGHADVVTSVAYSRGGLCVVSGSGDKTIRLWNARTGQPIGQPLEGHIDTVTSVAYSPDDACIVSGSNDKTIRIWDAHTGQTIGQPLQGHTWIIWSVAYSPDGAYIISGSGDKTIRIWDTRTGQAVGQPLQGHTEAVVSVAYSPDGEYIVSGSDDRTVRIWDAQSGAAFGKIPESRNNQTHSIDIDPLHIIPSPRCVGPHIYHPGYRTVGPYTACTMNDDGWVVINNSQLLIWVPPDIRHVLLLPPSTAVISRDGSLPLSLDYSRIGEHWQNHI